MIDLNIFQPDFAIDCKELQSSGSIYEIFRENGIKKSYAYAMGYRRTPFSYQFLKIGMSNPVLTEVRDAQVGERVVRQMAHFPEWDKQAVSPNGYDFYRGVVGLIANGDLKENFGKNDITIGVWDITKRYPSIQERLLIEESEVVRWAEGELTNQHNMLFGWRPVLNIQNPANSTAYKNGYVPKEVAELFS
jgi:hypothetical protein